MRSFFVTVFAKLRVVVVAASNRLADSPPPLNPYTRHEPRARFEFLHPAPPIPSQSEQWRQSAPTRPETPSTAPSSSDARAHSARPGSPGRKPVDSPERRASALALLKQMKELENSLPEWTSAVLACRPLATRADSLKLATLLAQGKFSIRQEAAMALVSEAILDALDAIDAMDNRDGGAWADIRSLVLHLAASDLPSLSFDQWKVVQKLEDSLRALHDSQALMLALLPRSIGPKGQ